MNSKFEWDSEKAERNQTKHDVSFEEAKTIFSDPLFITKIDDAHSIDETRFVTMGFSKRGRLLIVAHTDRDSRIRIISARVATKSEERYYGNTY